MGAVSLSGQWKKEDSGKSGGKSTAPRCANVGMGND
jgi:hypothetical protein